MMFDRTRRHPEYVYRSLFSSWEKVLDRAILPRMPKGIQTYHLTLATLCWSALAVIAGSLAQDIRGWVWGITVSIVLHYFTDHFDGAVGRMRGTGLVRWGYYMDHLLDFLFLTAVWVGYLLMFPEYAVWIIGILGMSAAFMAHSFLVSLVTGRFHISYYGVGPVEFWIVLIVLNFVIFISGAALVPWVFGALCIGGYAGLGIVIVRTQRMLWNADLDEKARRTQEILSQSTDASRTEISS